MTTAQPIAFSSNEPQDFPMGSGSFTGQIGHLQPSPYTRHFMGSPMSFRSGSFGSRFYPGMSPGQLLGPLDPNDIKLGKMSSSIESDGGSIVNALAMLERQDELCRDYTCCGLHLTDLHALVDHFEECHVVVLDPYAPQQPLPQTLPTSSAPNSAVSYFPNNSSSVPSQQSSRLQSQQHISYQGFDPDDMELDLDQNPSAPSSGAPSPPDTPISTPLSGYPSPTSYSGAPSPHGSQPPSPISAFETTTVLPPRGHHSSALGGFRSSVASGAAGNPPRTEDAFNSYSGYSDYSNLLPGTTPMATGPNALYMQQQGMTLGSMNGQQNGQACAPTALILSTSQGNTPDSTPASSRVASPSPGQSGYRAVAPNAHASSSSSTAAASTSGAGSSSTARASTTLSRPATSLLLSKPFKCPKPNCNKSYKQANGLKYHMTHGSCNFAPPKDLEHLQELLASKRSEKAKAAGESGVAEGEVTLSESELREVEKEAERRLRPYACGVGECQRRYKNMNGLRYHYQHSGDHGAIGLALLASGQHECLQHNKSRHATPGHSHSHSHSHSASVPRTPTSPAGTTTFGQQQAQAFAQPPAYTTPAATASNPPPYAYSYAQQQQQQSQSQFTAAAAAPQTQLALASQPQYSTGMQQQ
ncbi:uncharacterized protein BXZ73DRAFT_99247 [Epithele typhae]|uniref:uncharacterized protein n=1 Tax=Epithele typhae TaxID=378194 RepID=UPI0020085217|nr:uncharacterized protein BXZ73DRAFT_99247 [Epithele typhae]KAH9939631.1 hypothetical protein BXZ73DRAFT_99247 [Epithele typhae]